MDEKVFLDAGAVKVTNTRFVVGNQTYAMASVNSVKTTKTDVTPSTSLAVWMVAIGAVWLLAHLISDWKDLAGHLFPAAILCAGGWWIKQTKQVFEYKLVLTTSSGETTALKSRKSDDVEPVERAITDAIIYRG